MDILNSWKYPLYGLHNSFSDTIVEVDLGFDSTLGFYINKKTAGSLGLNTFRDNHKETQLKQKKTFVLVSAKEDIHREMKTSFMVVENGII